MRDGVIVSPSRTPATTLPRNPVWVHVPVRRFACSSSNATTVTFVERSLSMEWTCASCGTVAYAERVDLVVAMGWTLIADDRTGLCIRCRVRDDPAMAAVREMRRSAIDMRERAREQLESARDHRLRTERLRRRK